MNNFDTADLVNADNASAVSAAYPADGALVTVADGDTIRRGRVTVANSGDADAAGESRWLAITADSQTVWTGRVAPENITVEQEVAPEWWSEEVVTLSQAIIRADRERIALVEDAHRWADENSLCGTFDRFMREHELPPRRREYSAPTTVTLTMDLPVSVVARYGEDAQSLLNRELVEDAVRQRLGGLRRYSLAVGDYSAGALQE